MPLRNPPPVPEGMFELMKNLAKHVIKEQPENIYKFAAEYFENLLRERDGSLNKGYEEFQRYENEIKRRKLLSSHNVSGSHGDNEESLESTKTKETPTDIEINGVAMQVKPRNNKLIPKLPMRRNKNKLENIKTESQDNNSSGECVDKNEMNSETTDTNGDKEDGRERMMETNNDGMEEAPFDVIADDHINKHVLTTYPDGKPIARPRSLSSKMISQGLIAIKEESTCEVHAGKTEASLVIETTDMEVDDERNNDDKQNSITRLDKNVSFQAAADSTPNKPESDNQIKTTLDTIMIETITVGNDVKQESTHDKFITNSQSSDKVDRLNTPESDSGLSEKSFNLKFRETEESAVEQNNTMYQVTDIPVEINNNIKSIIELDAGNETKVIEGKKRSNIDSLDKQDSDKKNDIAQGTTKIASTDMALVPLLTKELVEIEVDKIPEDSPKVLNIEENENIQKQPIKVTQSNLVLVPVLDKELVEINVDATMKANAKDIDKEVAPSNMALVPVVSSDMALVPVVSSDMALVPLSNKELVEIEVSESMKENLSNLAIKKSVNIGEQTTEIAPTEITLVPSTSEQLEEIAENRIRNLEMIESHIIRNDTQGTNSTSKHKDEHDKQLVENVNSPNDFQNIEEKESKDLLESVEGRENENAEDATSSEADVTDWQETVHRLSAHIAEKDAQQIKMHVERSIKAENEDSTNDAPTVEVNTPNKYSEDKKNAYKEKEITEEEKPDIKEESRNEKEIHDAKVYSTLITESQKKDSFHVSSTGLNDKPASQSTAGPAVADTLNDRVSAPMDSKKKRKLSTSKHNSRESKGTSDTAARDGQARKVNKKTEEVINTDILNLEGEFPVETIHNEGVAPSRARDDLDKLKEDSLSNTYEGTDAKEGSVNNKGASKVNETNNNKDKLTHKFAVANEIPSKTKKQNSTSEESIENGLDLKDKESDNQQFSDENDTIESLSSLSTVKANEEYNAEVSLTDRSINSEEAKHLTALPPNESKTDDDDVNSKNDSNDSPQTYELLGASEANNGKLGSANNMENNLSDNRNVEQNSLVEATEKSDNMNQSRKMSSVQSNELRHEIDDGISELSTSNKDESYEQAETVILGDENVKELDENDQQDKLSQKTDDALRSPVVLEERSENETSEADNKAQDYLNPDSLDNSLNPSLEPSMTTDSLADNKSLDSLEAKVVSILTVPDDADSINALQSAHLDSAEVNTSEEPLIQTMSEEYYQAAEKKSDSAQSQRKESNTDDKKKSDSAQSNRLQNDADDAKMTATSSVISGKNSKHTDIAESSLGAEVTESNDFTAINQQMKNELALLNLIEANTNPTTIQLYDLQEVDSPLTPKLVPLLSQTDILKDSVNKSDADQQNNNEVSVASQINISDVKNEDTRTNETRENATVSNENEETDDKTVANIDTNRSDTKEGNEATASKNISVDDDGNNEEVEQKTQIDVLSTPVEVNIRDKQKVEAIEEAIEKAIDDAFTSHHKNELVHSTKGDPKLGKNELHAQKSEADKTPDEMEKQSTKIIETEKYKAAEGKPKTETSTSNTSSAEGKNKQNAKKVHNNLDDNDNKVEKGSTETSTESIHSTENRAIVDKTVDQKNDFNKDMHKRDIIDVSLGESINPTKESEESKTKDNNTSILISSEANNLSEDNEIKKNLTEHTNEQLKPEENNDASGRQRQNDEKIAEILKVDYLITPKEGINIANDSNNKNKMPVSRDLASSDFSDSDTEKVIRKFNESGVDETSRDERDEVSEVENFDLSSCGEDSLEAMYYMIRKNEIMLDKNKMDKKKVETEEEEKFSFPEKTTENLGKVFREMSGKKSLSSMDSSADEVVVKNFSTDTEPHYSHPQSASSVTQDDNTSRPVNIKNQENKHLTDEEFTNPILASMRRNEKLLNQMHAKALTIHTMERRTDEFEKDEFPAQQPLEDMQIGNIERKIMASSLSEADSDFNEQSTIPYRLTKDDFNVSTTFGHMGSTTDSDSTIESAATKIQAGARGFLTRRRLRSGADTSGSIENHSSIGNAAIDNSLEKLAANREQQDEVFSLVEQRYTLIQETIERTDTVDGLSIEESSVLGITEIKMEQRTTEVASGSNEKINVSVNHNYSGSVQRRLTLQRNDAVQESFEMDNTNQFEVTDPDAMGTNSKEDDETLPVKEKSARNLYRKQQSSSAKETNASRDRTTTLRTLGPRQRSMPVQIDSQLIRVCPKHMRKRIKSADLKEK